jgi:hypothetical protein
LLLAAAACLAALAFVTESQASAAALTPGDVVIYRVGNGAVLGSAAVPVFFDEYDSSGKLVESIALPTTTSAPNHRLTASGSGSSEGLLTLSANGQYLIGTGYDAALGTSKVAETANPGVARTLARVSASGEIDTTTALTDVSNENNARGAASNDGNEFWWSGAGKKTSGGVHYATLGATTSTLMSTTEENARSVAIFNGQLYASADPTKEGNTISTVGSGLPTTATTTTNLPFATAPNEPYAFTMVTLGLGSAPDTMYVADNGAGAIVKYGLVSGKWVKQGSVAVTAVTGVTADDSNGTVTLYATSSGSSGEGGVLDEITDNSGVGGTLTGSATQIATAPSGEAFRGVAFTPGTTFGSGGTPPPPAPTITPEETSLPAAIGDPTNPTLGLKVSDVGVEASELTVTASSSNENVAASAEVSGSGASRTLTVTPGSTVGHSTITLTVKAPEGGGESSTTIDYGLSANQGDASDRYYAGAGNGSTAIDVGGGYMVVGDDESNVLRLYHERNSGQPTKTFDFTKVLPNGASEIDIESSGRSGNTLYWLGSMANKNSGSSEPTRDIVFAATITGSGASTELSYLGSYKHLREDMVEWDEANGNPLGLAGSAASGKEPKQTNGFNAEGLEFAPGSTSTAYIAFRAPLEPPNNRKAALLIPVTNFSSLVTNGNPGSTKATFGSALQWNLGGLGLRELRKNAADEYLAIAGSPDGSNSSFGLYEWDGNPADQPVLVETPLPPVNEGAWEDIVSVPNPIADGSTVELLEDNGDSVWYADGLTSKTGMATGLQKDIARVLTISLPAPPAPSAPGTPQLASGSTPNDNGVFTLSWEASATAGVTYTLQHEDAEGGWDDVASGLSSPEYAFTLGSPEAEGTWTYRAIADSAKAESEPSGASEPVVVDETPPTLEITCPATAVLGQSGLTATVTAADGQSGLALDPSGTVAIDTSKAGPVTIERTASDNVGHSTTSTCITQVVHTQVITGTIKAKLIVKDGEAIELAPGAKAGGVEVRPGGALDVNGASTKAIKSSGATVIRICGATGAGGVKIIGSTGQVVLGDGAGCAASSFAHAVTLTTDTGGQTVVGETIGAKLAVTGGSGGTTVTNNTITKGLLVSGNAGEVIDTPNTVGGRSKIQSRRLR